jgi:signal transduction histidine kinase
MRVTPTRVIVGVLVASVAVASLLAFEAISAARSREAVSNAMLRQYAELAAWEFSRAARQQINAALDNILSKEAHPENRGTCDCARVERVDNLFDFTADVGLHVRSGAMTEAVFAAVARHVQGGRTTMEGGVQLRPLPGPGDRFVAFRWEPHVGAAGGQIGLVAPVSALTAVLQRTYEVTELLPHVEVDARNRDVVDLAISGPGDVRLFQSSGTQPGPQVHQSELLSDHPMPLRVRASMTPAFVATLGPEHGGGPNLSLILGLASVNALMVAIGLWQLRRERELARLRADFVAGVSHELRTPLAQMRMFSDTLLLDRIRNAAERRRAIEIIARETRRLSQLVENVLYFHRHQRAPGAPPQEPIDLAAVVVEVVDDFRPLAAARRVGLAIRMPVEELIAQANADGVRQVLLNLLDNAVKFGPTDDSVTVALERVEGGARLSVEDRGAGVDAADRERIFQPYERGDTGGAGGAGIGLAVVRRIVTEHHGTVAVEDRPGGGARFVVTLPLSEAHADQPAMDTPSRKVRAMGAPS